MKRDKPADIYLGDNIHLVSKKYTKNSLPLGYYRVCKPPEGYKNDMFGLWILYKNKYHKVSTADILRCLFMPEKVKRIRVKNGKPKRKVRRR